MINKTIYIFLLFCVFFLSCVNDEGEVNYAYKVVAKIEAYRQDFRKLPDSLSELIPYYIPSEDSAHLVSQYKYRVIPGDPADTGYYPSKGIFAKDYFSLEFKINKERFTYYRWDPRTKNFDLVWF